MASAFSAQSVPQKINYQAVARDGSGELITNSSVSVDISILSGSSTGTVVYEETHAVTTNNYGLFYFKIGEGSVISGSMTGISWGSADHFLNVQVNGDDLGTVQLVSVPYAFQAGNAASIAGNVVNTTAPTNGQVLVFNGTTGEWEAQAPSGSAGANSILTSTVEPAGANCTSGGYFMEYGTDDDNSGVLDAGEVDGSYYVCNGTDGVDGIDGADGVDGTSLVWLGSLAAAPSTPNLNEAYYNMTTGQSEVWDGSTWQVIAVDGIDGTDGVDGTSLVWLGSLATAPSTPNLNEAYYNTTTGQSEVWDGSTWQIIAVDGIDGAVGADGNTWTVGSGAPTGGVNAGDMYLDNSTNDYYSFDGSAWNLEGNLLGTESITTLVDNLDGTFTYTSEDNTVTTFDANIDDADADVTNELQDISFNTTGDSLLITNGSGLEFSSVVPSPGQVLGWNGTSWEAQNAGVDTDDQSISFNAAGDSITITDGTGLLFSAAAPASGQVLSWDGSQWTSIDLLDNDAANELQDISFNASGDSLLITNGTGVQFSAAIPTTGQVLAWNGSSWEAQNAGVDTDDQSIAFNTAGDSITITDGTGLLFSAAAPTSGQVLSWDGSQWTSIDLLDNDAANELQDISFNASGDSLLITNGTGVQFSTVIPTTGQVLAWNGSNWEAQNAGVDTDDQSIAFNAAGDSITITDGTGLSFSTTAPALGEVLTWNGSNWQSIALLDNDATNEFNTSFGLNGTLDSLVISDAGTSYAVALTDISSAGLDEDPTNEYNTAFGLNGSLDSLIIDDMGNHFAVALTDLNIAGLDEDPTNEYNTAFGLNGSLDSLIIDDMGNHFAVALTDLNIAGLDEDPTNEYNTAFGLNGSLDSLIIDDMGNHFAVALTDLNIAGLDEDPTNEYNTAFGLNGSLDSLIIDDMGNHFAVALTDLNIAGLDEDPTNEYNTAFGLNGSLDSLIIDDMGNHFAVALTDLNIAGLDEDPTNEYNTAFGLNGSLDSLIIDDMGNHFAVALTDLNIAGLDEDPTNEYNTAFGLNGSLDSLIIDDMGNHFAVALTDLNIAGLDEDPNNELITGGTLNGTDLEITDAGGTTIIDLSTLATTETTTTLVDNLDGTFTYTSEDLTVTTFDANIDDADASVTNEIQNLSISGNTVSIDGGGTGFDLSGTPPTASDVLTWNGSAWEAQGATGEANTASNQGAGGVGPYIQKTGVDLEFKNLNTNSTAITITDDAANSEIDIDFDASTLSVGDLGDVILTTPSNGQVLEFDGSNWVNVSPSTAIFANTGTVTSNENGDYATDDFVFGSPTTAYTTESQRFFFDKSKGSFRAGGGIGAEWDDLNVGDYSMALGFAATASGYGSFAVSNNSVASGGNSIAIGQGTMATSYGEVAVGFYNVSSAPINAGGIDLNDMVFSVGNGTSGTRSNAITVLKSGNTGLGTVAPTEKLHVVNGSIKIDDGANPYTLPGQDGTGGYVMQTDGAGVVSWVDPSSLGSSSRLEDATTTPDTYIDVDVPGDGTEDIIHFTTLGTEAMNINSSGSVGIGMDPVLTQSKLHVADVSSNGITVEVSSDLADAPHLNLLRSRGGVLNGAQGDVQNSDQLGYIDFIGWGGAGFQQLGARIEAVATENFSSSTNSGSKLSFSTAENGMGFISERMVIDQNGHVGINSPSPNSTLEVNGDIGLGGAALVESAVTVTLTNYTGVPSVKGDIVIIDPNNDGGFIRTTSDAHASVVGVVYESGVADGMPCKVAISGVVLVNADVNTVRGQHVITSGTTSGWAGSIATPSAGTSIGMWLQNVTPGSQGFAILK
ncbi:hypothetical protein CRYO30217_00966 [Parvicella tangerina]|uniref:DUF7151 domain-containing protein n=2 Tax=Parvicella tangerina TaxID=2829795 RepID=A0A916JL39_9FLAO|nr:hypothetical protein CRYO30217_00966 [Parvicella tangerina]